MMLVPSARGALQYTEQAFLTDQDSTRPLDEGGLLAAEYGSPQACTWSQLIDDLLALRTLEDDWDGQGAKAPHPSLVDGAITLAQYLRASGMPPADFATAGVNGTVIFEWHLPTEYREIEVTTPVRAEGRSVRRGSETMKEFLVFWRS
jgi:hypothetical protein